MNVSNEIATFYLEKYAKMLSLFTKQICNKCPDADYEEIHQILSIKLISIINTYKKGSCKESSYFYKIFERESRSIIKSYYSLKNYPFINQIDANVILQNEDNNSDIDSLSLSDSNDYLNPQDYLNEKNLLELIDDFTSKLDKQDRLIFLYNFQGMSAKEIATKLNIERKIVYKRLAFLKKTFAERVKLID